MVKGSRVRIRFVARWARYRLGSIQHERRVARVATAIFDLTRRQHGLDRYYRRLLVAAALVHDVGRIVEKSEHPNHGSRMILRDPRLRIAGSVRRALAFLTHYHRDDVPDLGDEEILTESDDRAALRKVLAILRAADALDSRSFESPRVVLGLKKQRLRITCYLTDPTEKVRRVYLRARKYRLLERELGFGVRISIRHAHSLRLVA